MYRGQAFFGIVHQGRLYFRTDATSRAAYLARGMGPFQPNPGQTLVSYYDVPPDILEDNELLNDWARIALAAQGATTPPSTTGTQKHASKPRK